MPSGYYKISLAAPCQAVTTAGGRTGAWDGARARGLQQSTYNLQVRLYQVKCYNTRHTRRHRHTDHRSLIIATQSVTDTVTLDCHVGRSSYYGFITSLYGLFRRFSLLRSTRTGWFHLYDSVYKLKRRDLVGDEEESLP